MRSFEHVAYEILGTLDPLLRDAGFRIKYVNFERHPDTEPSLDAYDGLIVLGGPMNVDEVEDYPNLETEVELIRQAIDSEMPVFTEPGLFLIKPDQTLFAAWISSFPHARPDFSEILRSIDFVKENQVPPRGIA